MQLESEEPSHRTFSTLGKSFKCLMNQNPLVTTDTQRSGVYKTDADTGPQQDFLDKNSQGQQYFLLQFHKTVIGNLFRKKMFQMFADIFLVIMLEVAETAGVEQDKNYHNLSITHSVGLVAMLLFLVFNHISFLLKCKFFAEIIGHTINLCNFRLWKHSDNHLNVIIAHYKFNTFIAMFLIISKIYLFLFRTHIKLQNLFNIFVYLNLRNMITLLNVDYTIKDLMNFPYPTCQFLV